ncbi:MAG: SPOR domain-containing protein [Ignavibacteriae bacterium]|nr:SPOR domain-containing protein [Ignavibacteriota bacterium]
MPDLNLNDEGNLEDLPSEEPSQPEEGEMTESAEPPRRERGGQGARMVIILVVLGVLGGAVYMVNKLGIVKLWGSSEPEVAQVQEQPSEQLPPQEEPQAEDQAAQQADQQAAQQVQAPPQQQVAQQKPVETPKIEERRKAENPMKLLDPIKFPKRTRPTQTATRQQTPAQQPQTQLASTQQQTTPVQKSAPTQEMGALPKVDMASLDEMQGSYTVQVYALLDKNNAETVVHRLADAGYPAFLEPIEARQMTWYTVRVGKFPSAADAKKAIENFAQEIKSHHFIDKIRMAGN